MSRDGGLVCWSILVAAVIVFVAAFSYYELGPASAGVIRHTYVLTVGPSGTTYTDLGGLPNLRQDIQVNWTATVPVGVELVAEECGPNLASWCEVAAGEGAAGSFNGSLNGWSVSDAAIEVSAAANGTATVLVTERGHGV